MDKPAYSLVGILPPCRLGVAPFGLLHLHWIPMHPDSGYPVAWRSPRVAFHIGPGETVRLSVEPRSKGSTYIGGWTIRRAANERAGVDAGCAILLPSERAWPGTTHRER